MSGMANSFQLKWLSLAPTFHVKNGNAELPLLMLSRQLELGLTFLCEQSRLVRTRLRRDPRSYQSLHIIHSMSIASKQVTKVSKQQQYKAKSPRVDNR